MILEAEEMARILISDPNRWTQRASARGADGIQILATDEDAVCWCSFGAVIKVTQGNYEVRGIVLNNMQREAVTSMGAYGSLVLFNDTRDHEDVLAFFDRVIAKEKALPSTLTVD